MADSYLEFSSVCCSSGQPSDKQDNLQESITSNSRHWWIGGNSGPSCTSCFLKPTLEVVGVTLPEQGSLIWSTKDTHSHQNSEILPETWHVPRSPEWCQEEHIHWECRKEPMNACCETSQQQQQEQRYNSKPFITSLVISNKVGTKVPFHSEGNS